MSVIKYFLVLIGSFLLTFVLTSLIYLGDVKSDIVEKFINQVDTSTLFFKKTLESAAINNDFGTVDSSIKTFFGTGVLNSIELEYKNYYFNKKAILNNSKKIRDDRYILSDVTTDYKNGEIKLYKKGIYIFKPHKEFDTRNILPVKFQSFKDDEVYNSISYLNFYRKLDNSTENKNKEISWLDELVKLDESKIKKSFSIMYEGEPFVDVNFTFNQYTIIEEIKTFIIKIFIYSINLFIIMIAILYLFYYKIVKKEIEKPVKKIELYIDDILDNKYIKVDKMNHQLLHIDFIYQKLQKISKKIAALTNDLNNKKDILTRQVFIDELTGLANKKVFEKDIQRMFATNKDGFIILTKINDLGAFANKNGSNDANHLIEDFGHGLVNILKKYQEASKVYRFYGAEFAVIIDMSDINKLSEILNNLSRTLDGDIKSKYLIDTDIAYYGATPFDNYGSIDSLLHSAHKSYITASTENNILFKISDNAELLQKNKENELVIKDIIDRSDFAVRFIYDTHEMDEPDNLLMQDASPLILDSNTFENFPIGTFMAIADRLNLSSAFDKIMVEKVLEYLANENIKYKIVVNLSIMSLTDRNFISWLEGILLYTKGAKESLVFSITSYNAKANLEKFLNLVEVAHKFDSKIMLKRFTLDDFTTEELEQFNIDYIRLDKDYCNGINTDKTKKHAIKNIILYSEMNDIYVLGDSIKSDEDYKTMSRLGIYGTSTSR